MVLPTISGGCYPIGRALEPFDAKHAPAVCKRINSSADFHGKSWSYRFMCPTCGASQRRNTNFLGNRHRLVCDGERIVRTHRDECPDSPAPRTEGR